MQALFDHTAAYGLLAVSLLIVGCGDTPSADYSDLDLIDVSGQVNLDGIVLKGARIEFVGSDASIASGTTDARGRYRLMFNSEKSGCLPGEKIVRIRMAPAEGDEEDPDAQDTSGVVIPSCYNSDSQLTANVSARRRTFDFALSTAAEDVTGREDVTERSESEIANSR